MQKIHHYKVVTKVQNELGILARIAIMLRKFNVNIQSLNITPSDEGKDFFNISWVLDSTKDEESFAVVVRKLERLIPVLEVIAEEI